MAIPPACHVPNLWFPPRTEVLRTASASENTPPLYSAAMGGRNTPLVSTSSARIPPDAAFSSPAALGAACLRRNFRPRRIGAGHPVLPDLLQAARRPVPA